MRELQDAVAPVNVNFRILGMVDGEGRVGVKTVVALQLRGQEFCY